MYFAGKSLKMQKIASILLFCLLIWGCKKPTAFQYKGIKNIQFENFAGDTAALSATISFFNPNKYAVQLKKIDADIFANDAFLSHYKLDTSITIPANSPFDFGTTIRFNRSNLFNNIISAFLKQEVLLHIKGNTRVGRSGFFVNVPFDFTQKQTLKF